MFETKQFRKIVSAIIYFTTTLTFLSVNNVSANDNQVNFALTDTPGSWFDTGTSVAGNRSIAIATPGVRVKFSGNSNTVHTRTSLIYPTVTPRAPLTCLSIPIPEKVAMMSR